ncbi:MAG TPA: (2Fe-2S)-binding protein [Streptosporangiaceae bacterium]|nr:(2Fe-2S)-binding protein [Streptosporangiaceae bacterium]
MYVCVCHAVTEDEVRERAAAGATSAKAVRAACGMRPGCGACVRRISAVLAECAAEHPERPGIDPVEHAPAA